MRRSDEIMRIGVDARYLREPRTGIGQYLHELLTSLLKIDEGIECHLFYQTELERDWRGLARTVGHRVASGRLKLGLSGPERWEQVSLPLTLLLVRPTLYHAVGMVGPVFSPSPLVATIHDLSFARYPEFFLAREAGYWNRWVPATARRAGRVLVNSEFTASEVQTLYGIPSSRIVVTPLGVASHFVSHRGTSTLRRVLAQYSLSRPYVLFVGTIQPRKNIVRLIGAFADVRRRYDIPHELVICGQRGWLCDDVFAAAAAPEIREHVRFLGHARRDDLPFLYSGADVFAYPSLYEGFGLPVLEAMACGTPVVTSRTSALPEVAGGSALLVDPTDVGEIADGLWHLIDNCKTRARLVASGLERACAFTWIRTAQLTLSAYREVVR